MIIGRLSLQAVHGGGISSETDKLILMGDCMRQVQAAHPSAPEKDAKSVLRQACEELLIPAQLTEVLVTRTFP